MSYEKKLFSETKLPAENRLSSEKKLPYEKTYLGRKTCPVCNDKRKKLSSKRSR